RDRDRGLDARHPPGRGQVERLHRRRGEGTTEDAAVEHSREPHVRRVLGLAGRLGLAVEPRLARPDDRELLGGVPGGGVAGGDLDLLELEVALEADADLLFHASPSSSIASRMAAATRGSSSNVEEAGGRMGACGGERSAVFSPATRSTASKTWL